MSEKTETITSGTDVTQDVQSTVEGKKTKWFRFKSKKKPGAQFKKSKKLTVKKLILLIVAAAALGGGGYGLYRLFFYEEPVQIITGTTVRDSITTVIEGSATTTPASFQMLTIPVDGTVKSVDVSQGDQVNVGDLLYTIDTADVQADIDDMEATILDYETELDTYNENISNLTINAPFAGKLINVNAEAGDSVNTGATLATIVDDSRLTLSLYFSYAYADYITKGMSAEVSVPDYMSTISGTVKSIDKVSYVTSEGAECFKVNIVIDNPGSLTEGLVATAEITSAGMTMAPADSGKLEYYQQATISAEVSGKLSSVRMIDYTAVSSGEVLAVIDNDDYSKQLVSLQNKLESSKKNLAELQETLADCTATAEVAGTVIFIRVEAGDEVSKGSECMAIYNTDTMEIEADINETDIEYIQKGMEVTITKSGSSNTTFKGTVTEVSLEASASNGVATFPVTISIPSDGALSAGVYVSYSITAAQASDVVLAPIAALQSTAQGRCLFIQSDTKPDNAVDLDEGVVPDGYYAVTVETGLSSNQYIEIKSGVDEGVTVFEQYVVTSSTAGSDQTSQTSDSGTQMMPGVNGQFPGGDGQRPGGFSGGPMGG
jgi:HlyD family secretion protein